MGTTKWIVGRLLLTFGIYLMFFHGLIYWMDNPTLTHMQVFLYSVPLFVTGVPLVCVGAYWGELFKDDNDSL